MEFPLVYPKHKKGNTKLTDNSQPFSILPTISKYLEKKIYKQITTFHTTNQRISPYQHDFQEGRSINFGLNLL